MFTFQPVAGGGISIEFKGQCPIVRRSCKYGLGCDEFGDVPCCLAAGGPS